MLVRRRVAMVAGLAVLASLMVGAGSAEAVESTTVSGRVTTTTGVSLDVAVVEACPPGVAHSFQPVCAGGVITSTSTMNGYYSLTLPSAGDWSLQAGGRFCSAGFTSPESPGTLSGAVTRDLVIDTTSLVEPAAVDLAPPFADGAPVAGETEPSDGRVHLALRDTSRRILVGGFPGGPCVGLSVPYRPLQVVVLIPEGTGPFPLLVSSHGSGENAVNPGRVGGSLEYVARGYAVAIPTYPLTARYGTWPGGYNRDVDDQGRDLAFMLEELTQLPFVDADRVGLAGISAGGYTSLLTAFHEMGYDGGLRAVAPTIARPLTAPLELDVPLRPGDVPLFMANNVDDVGSTFSVVDAFWQSSAAPKFRWLEDTPAVFPEFDHGFSSPEPPDLIATFFDAYLLGDPAARAELIGYPDPPSPEYTFEAVPGTIGFRGPLAKPVTGNVGRTIPIELQLYAKVGSLSVQITAPNGVTTAQPLAYDRVAGTYELSWRTKGLAKGDYQLTVQTAFGPFAQSVRLR